jgi:hypothetical protein
VEQPDPQLQVETLLLDSGSVRDYLDDFALRASHRLGGDTEISITLRHSGHDRLVATSSERAARCDEVEHAKQAGPCVTAMDHLQVVLVPDIVEETRWNSWRQAALDAGYRSSAGVPAHVADGAEIALNLYSERVNPWDSDLLVRADIFAQDVARTVRLCLQLADLTRSLADAQAAQKANDAIEQAITETTESGASVPDALERLARDGVQDRPDEDGRPPTGG